MSLRRSLTFKLIAAFLGVSLLAVALVVAVNVIAASVEFNRFISQEAQSDFTVFVADYYTSSGSLQGIDDALRQRLESRPPAPAGASTFEIRRILPFGLADPTGSVVLPGDGYRVGATVPTAQLSAGTRVLVNGQVVGIVLPFTRTPPRNRAQEQYLERTATTLLLAAGGAALVAVLLGIMLARTITRPVRELTLAAERLARGELNQTVRVQSRDEVGQLAAAFNRMSADLARADVTRRQMTADIAHELRNPLTVIGGYLDAMRSGDLEPTPARLEAVYMEIAHLEGIVQDLRTLSLAEAGALALDRAPVLVQELLPRLSARFMPQAARQKITLSVDAPQSLPAVHVDDTRLTQVLDNLLTNALQHTPEGGRIKLTATAAPDALQIAVSDTGPGIAPEVLPRIFERFYRGDPSRATDARSSGLGLAIARALVDAHGGRIRAQSELGRGTTFYIELPRVADRPVAGTRPPAAGTEQLQPV